MVNIILYLHPNTGKYFITQKRKQLEKYWQNDVNGDMKGRNCLYHVNRPIERPPKISISSFMGHWKGKMLMNNELKYKYRTKNFVIKATMLMPQEQ